VIDIPGLDQSVPPASEVATLCQKLSVYCCWLSVSQIKLFIE
jgi:hypothetical protein